MALSAAVNVFAGSSLDRAADRREDAAWLEVQLERDDGAALALWDGKVLVEDGPNGPVLARLSPAKARDAAGDDWVFLGLEATAPVFGVEFKGEADPTAGPLAGRGRFVDMRGAAVALAGAEAAMAGCAKSLFDWRRRHGFCAACGQRSRSTSGGWKRVCDACGSEHFPRVDPVVIMLPTHRGRCLMGRQAAWPPTAYSALAGFLEPGESIEEACARELMEEAGLEATGVTYHSSQPWPFPSSLMIGLFAEVKDDQARPDQTELEAVRWFTRDEARAVLAGTFEGVRAPNPYAIARTLLEAWVAKAP